MEDKKHFDLIGWFADMVNCMATAQEQNLFKELLWLNINIGVIIITLLLALSWMCILFIVMNNLYVEIVGAMVIYFAGYLFQRNMNRRVFL